MSWKSGSFPLHRKGNRGSEGTGDWLKNWIWTQGSLNTKSSALSCTPALKGPNVSFCSSIIGMSPSPPSPTVTKRPGTTNRSWLPTASRKESSGQSSGLVQKADHVGKRQLCHTRVPLHPLMHLIDITNSERIQSLSS